MLVLDLPQHCKSSWERERKFSTQFTRSEAIPSLALLLCDKLATLVQHGRLHSWNGEWSAGMRKKNEKNFEIPSTWNVSAHSNISESLSEHCNEAMWIHERIVDHTRTPERESESLCVVLVKLSCLANMLGRLRTQKNNTQHGIRRRRREKKTFLYAWRDEWNLYLRSLLIVRSRPCAVVLSLVLCVELTLWN